MRLTELTHIGMIKDQYAQLRSRGCSREEATGQLLRSTPDLTHQDRLTFWIGLADGQYARKELHLAIALQGLIALNRLSQLWPEITPGDIQRRRKHYSQAPMHTRKPGRPRKESP